MVHPLHHWPFAPKTMSPPPYTTIPLCTTYCVPLYPLVWPFYNVPTTIYHYSTAILSLSYCVLWFDLYLHQRQCPHHHITNSTAFSYCIPGLTFLHQSINVLSLFHCILRTVSTAWGWPFCTKGNGPDCPYLLSTLCQLTFLHQHLLHPVHPHCIHCYPICPTCPTSLTFLHLQSVPVTQQRYS